MRQKGKGFLSIILAVIMVLGSASNLPLAGVFADGPSPGSASYQNEAAGPSPAVEGGQGEEAGPSWGLYRLAADEPANESGVYQIGTAAHLVWLAEEVNGGRPDVSAKLAADIDLGPIPEWTPIGSTPGNSFSGTFDGGCHKISRLSVTNDSYRGLFGYIGAGGTVKNLTISDSSVVGAGHLGLVAGSNAGTISGIAVEDSEVATLAKQTNLGGIAGINSGTVTACANISAAVTQTEAADGSSAGTGGIVGANTGTVSFSFNKAEVKNGNNDNYNGFNAGIAGFNGIGGTIASCYNAGKIGMAYRSGGIAGANSGTIANSYNIGTVNEGGYAGRGGGISVTGTASNVTNSYYLDSSIVSSANFGTAKTEAELKAMAADLGGAFDNDLAPQINGGYPVLKWQNPSAEYGVSLTAKPAGAEVSFGPGGGPAIAPDSSAGGVYTFKALPRGSYEYAVSEDGGDYVRQAGAIDISYSDVNMVIELERRLYPVEFSVSPQDATVSITEEGYEQSKSAAGGSASFELPMGAYTYAVDRFGFIGQTGTVTVAKGDGAGTVTKVLAESEKHNVTFAVNVPEAIVTVTHPADGVQAPASANSYNLYVGNTYSYTVKCKGYVTQTGTATIGGSDESIQITLLEGITAWDGESKSEPALVDGVYQIFDAEELAWFRDKANSQLKLGSGSNAANIANNSTSSNISAILRSDIDLGGCEWLPIGTYVNDQSSYWGVPYGYAGTFDGNGHAIRGLSITTGANGSGLFGCVFAGTVKNLTVAGSVFGGQYSGGIAGIAYGGGSTSSLTPAPATGSTISNCANYVDVSTGRSGANAFIGGIAGSIGNHGYSKEAGLIEYCTNYGTVNGGETNSYIGGIVGDGAYGVSVRNCGNEGAVSGLGNVGGIAGDSAIPISGCYNAGAITGADAASSSASRTGGIAGGSANAIENSYNTGAVAGKTDIGGIVGLLKNTSADSAAAVRNSYNAGAISKPGGASATSGAIAGGKSGAYKAVFNTYYLDTAAANGIGSNAHAEDSAVSKTAAELKGADVLEALGSQFGSDLPTPVNGGYPILKWQGAEAADTAVDIDAIGLSAPATGAPAQTAVSTPQYTGTVSWAPALPPNGSFAAEVAYTATIALTARDGYTFDGVPADFFKVDGAATVSNAAGSGEVTAVFPATRALAGITVKLRAQSGFEFLYTSENLAVAEGLAAQYGFSNAAAVPPGTITALDALVAAHAARYGAAFTAETAAGYLTMNGGSPQAFFGNNETGKYSGFAINHAYPMISGAGYTVNEAPVSEGDVIDFFYYEDASWMDYLTWFADAAGNAVDSLTVDQGEEFTLKIKGFMYMGGYASPPPEDIYNEGEGMLQVFAAGDEGNILGDVRSAAGITLSFDEAGVYRLTAQGFESDNDALIVPPFIVVNVVEGGAPADAPVSISAIPGIGSPAYGKTAPISMVTAQYTGTVAWSPAIPAGGSFAADTAYTATITLAARPGYTFEGVAADFFTVDGLRGENAAGSGTVTVAFPATGPAPQQPADAAEARGGALGYLKAAVSAPTFADIGGEWTIIALARSGYTDTVYYDGYYSRVLAAIAGREAKLDADKSTENSRLILALTSLGIDAASVGGKDLVAPLLSDMAWVTKQGINGAIYALLAVDSGGYAQTGVQADAQADVQTGAQAGRQADAQASVQADAQAGAQADTRADAQMGVQADTQTGAQALVDHIVNNKAGAGWALAGQVPAVDITAMAIQALAPHYEQPAVKAAVDSALGWLAAQDV
ncbi:MAG: hypothetical protein LBH39_06770, partial [Clostridiales Family XIII bacterium]|nr:hypothetical protein [Clostridiales Family XIII bacterium]